ncbi:MAG: hypothetical protein Q8L64_02715 [bacterium]|nr:hypothetical protein [bacterium]
MIGQYIEGDPASYQNVAAAKGFRHLNLEQKLYSKFVAEFGKDAWWTKINEPFIRYTANSRKSVCLSTDPKRIHLLPKTSNLLREYNLFRRLGYSEPIWDPAEGLWKMTLPKP